MLAVEEAQEQVLAAVAPLPEEEVSLGEALGRVLREDVIAPADVPQRDNTAMDGYAVRAGDLDGATQEHPAILRVIEDLPAGSLANRSVEPGTAIRIMTGALMPDGADAVAHVEITDAGRETVRVYQPIQAGTHIRRRGEDMLAGDIVVSEGIRIGPGEIGVLAAVQKSVLRVGRRPEVAILSTGNELIGIDEVRTPGKVVNSNAWALEALVREAGAIPRPLGIVRDTREATIAAFESALASDVIISSGGVSAGAYDFVKDALDALGAETKFWQVAMKPGKPVVLSTLRGRICFGLPGNPVSCMVSFHLFVAPALRKLMGQTTDILPPAVSVRMAADMTSRGDRRTYHRVRVVARDGSLLATPMRAQGSGVTTSMVQANALAIMERGVTHVEAGSVLPAVLFGMIGQ